MILHKWNWGKGVCRGGGGGPHFAFYLKTDEPFIENVEAISLRGVF